MALLAYEGKGYNINVTFVPNIVFKRVEKADVHGCNEGFVVRDIDEAGVGKKLVYEVAHGQGFHSKKDFIHAFKREV